MTVPIDPNTAISGIASGLKLLDSMVHMIQQARDEGHEISMSEIVGSLPNEARVLARRIRESCKEFQSEFDGKDLNKTVDELQKDYWFWQKKRYRLVRYFNNQVRTLGDAINDLYMDFVAIAHCKEAENIIAKSFQELDPQRKEIEGLVNSKATVKEILDKLMEHAWKLEMKLGDLVGKGV